jgi:hypothetical protein
MVVQLQLLVRLQEMLLVLALLPQVRVRLLQLAHWMLVRAWVLQLARPLHGHHGDREYDLKLQLQLGRLLLASLLRARLLPESLAQGWQLLWPLLLE